MTEPLIEKKITIVRRATFIIRDQKVGQVP
ncbi:MAG: hypothetical protein JWQ25_1292 [Daejeonella sp.]|nr:hypothetical protein [Daejeonella sp.]